MHKNPSVFSFIALGIFLSSVSFAQAITIPVIEPHPDVIVEATTFSSTAFATYSAPFISGTSEQATCLPASGSEFSYGDTEVTCSYPSATDTHFIVRVQDTVPPRINARGPVKVEAIAPLTPVTYSPPNQFDPAGFRTDSTQPASCTPPPGSLFPVGTTTVTCTPVDSHGNVGTSTSFEVIVTLPVVIDPPTCDAGFHFDGFSCVADPVVVVDVCANLEGVQEKVPDGLVLEGTDQCVAPLPPVVSGGTGSGGGGGRSGSIRSGGGAQLGQVLGAFTANASCGPLLKTYMRMGGNNDREEVRKLQTFLNDQLHMTIPVTGFFGSQTNAGVIAFQNAHASSVLVPWGENEKATGYVYKTTRWQINDLFCKDSEPFPQIP